MKTPMMLIAGVLTLGLAAMDADAARRFGGGGNLGKQRDTPMAREAPKQAPAAAPAQAAPAQAAPAAVPASAQPKPGFMGRWGGMLAGLGIGVLLASMFGSQLGPIVGMLLMVLLVGGIGYLLFRLLASRGGPPAKPLRFESVGAPVTPRELKIGASVPGYIEQPVQEASTYIPSDFNVQAFVRQGKTAFIRLQAANDAKDLADIRDYTTPEMYAELAMQIGERDDAPQKTEVVMLDAELLEVATADGYDIASVRFSGLIRENESASPMPFDEVWHVRKKAGDAKAPWLIAGIQQSETSVPAVEAK
jgi:predicted lipid-binding transport protein (Tim44 family)